MSLRSLFSSPKLPAPTAPPPLPTRADPEVEAERRRAQQVAGATRGRPSTVLAGGGEGPRGAGTRRTLLTG